MRIQHIAISVIDSEITAKFYRENFGFQEINRFTKLGWDGGCIVLMLEDIRLEIFSFDSEMEKKDDLSNLKVVGLKHIGIEVKNVHEKYMELKEKDLDIDEPVKGTTCTWFCFLRDPDGIPIEMIEL